LSALAEALHRFDLPWIKVGKIYRRICFLRSEGLALDAQHLEETELVEATAQARRCAGSEFEAESILQRLLTEEKERVADAIALAEIIVPMLAERLGSLASLPMARAAPAPRQARPEAPVEPRGIADFIDDMLTQERRVQR
jgi:hypothetical protein